MSRRSTALVLALAAAAVPGTVAAAASPGMQVEVDLVARATGARVASLSGSVDASGQGYASIVPLSGAAGVGMARDESAQVRRLADGRLFVVGGLGTRVILRPDVNRRHAVGVGRLSVALRSGRTVRVGAAGLVATSPFRPRPKQIVLVVGTSTGAIHDAMAKRYRLVPYSPDTDSRAALLRNPARYASIAGLLVGNNVSRSALAKMDLARSFYNGGRWVATSGSPTAVDQHMYVAAHAHLGTAGVMIRRATPALGGTSNAFMQVREPRIAHVRVGRARTRAYATPRRSQMQAAVAAGAADLQTAIARDEVSAGGAAPTGTAHENAAGSPPVVSANSGLAVLNVPVHQLVNVIVSTPSVPGVLGGTFTCTNPPAPSGGGLNYLPAKTPSTSPAQPACPSPVAQQLVNLTYNPVYSVTLQTTGANSPWQQTVAETSATEVNAVAQPSSAMGTGSVYSVQGQTVLPATWGALQIWNVTDPSTQLERQPSGRARGRSEHGGTIPTFTCYPGTPCPNVWGTLYGTSQEWGLELAEAVHSVSMACSGCSSTTPADDPGGPSVAYDVGNSKPNSQVIQSAANATSGTDWDDSSTATSGWSVGGNLGLFGSIVNGGLSGGYNSSTAQTTSQGGNFSTSTGFTFANWVTTGTGLPPEGTSPSQAVYTSISTNIPGASGTAASAAQSLNFGGLVSPTAPNSGGYVVSPGPQYGSVNPGPSCAPGNGQWPCVPQASPTAAGSQMNAMNFQQGSVSAFTIDAGSGQLGIGSVLPYTMDNLYLADQLVNSGSVLNATSCFPGANGVSGCGNVIMPWGAGLLTELQVLDLGQSISAAQAQFNPLVGQSVVNGGASLSGGSTPTGLANSLTTYYNGKGTVLTGASSPKSPGVTYTTLGLDLCSPVVLTAELWSAGCNKAPGLSGPPATAQGAGPTISGPKSAMSTSSTGQALANLGTALTCKKGTWSGSPSYSYQWQQWNSTFSTWQNIAGATTAAYTPTAAGYVLCSVTATNSKGSTTAATPSVEMITPAAG